MKIIRHGESKANIDLLWGTDAPLTENGRRQAESIEPIETYTIVTSELIRAKQTADIIYPKEKKIVDSFFNEIDFGIAEGTHIEKDSLMWNYFRERPELLHIYTRGDNIKERADKALKRLYDYPDDTIIFTHGTLIQAMMCLVEYDDIRRMHNIKPLPNCGIWEVHKGEFRQRPL